MRRALALALVLAAALAACDAPATPEPTPAVTVTPGADDPSPPPTGATLRVAVDAPSTLVPFEVATPAELQVVDALFDALTVWGPDLRPEPAAAVAWSADDDARTWRFTLRPDGRFHDGTPVTSADVKWSWERAVVADRFGYLLAGVQGYADLRGGRVAGLSGLRIPDPHVLEVRLAEPDAEFATVVGHPALAPVPRSRYETDPIGYASQPIGNGPFAAQEPWAAGRFVRVRRAETWTGGPPVRLAEILFQVMDPETAYLAFQQGRIHVAPVPSGALADARRRFGTSPDGAHGPGVVDGPRLGVYLLGFDLRQGPFATVATRRALTQALDRAALAREILEGAVLPVDGLLPPALPAAVTESCPSCAHDPEAAAQAFAEAGVERLTFAYNDGGGHELVAARLRRAVGAAGVELTEAPLADRAYLRALRTEGLALFRFGWSPDVPTGAAMLRPLLHSASSPTGADDVDGLRHNYGRYADAEVDALLDTARATLDAPRREARYRRAARLAVQRDHAYAPLFAYRHRTVVAEDVEGLRLDATGRVDWARVRVVEPVRP